MHRNLGIASWWGILGVLLMVGRGMVRVLPICMEAFQGGLSLTQWAVALLWGGFMLFFEGYKGFHLKFSPMIVARAETLSLPEAAWWHKLLAPAYCMGWFHASRKRLIKSWAVSLGIMVIVVGVRMLPQPWRGILDVGVVLGLTTGLMSMLWWALISKAPLVSAEMPEH